MLAFLRLWVYFIACFIALTLFTLPLEAKKTVCLNMIVKDETPVIKRCLDSVKPLIDYWVIEDTGSTDGSQKMIQEIMTGIPGELHERPWVNFEHNRNEALKLAEGKADYVLFIDADEYFEYAPTFKLPELDKDFYYMNIVYGSTHYARTHLINNHLAWEWKGVLHEAIIPKPENSFRTCGTIENMQKIVVANEGARSKDPHKYERDAEILETALKEDPNNTRYVFYLARSYNDSGQYALALKNFEKRVAMGGWDQEVFESMLQIAHLHQQLKSDHDIIVKAYQDAFKFRPSRVDPLYYLARYLREHGDFFLAYSIAHLGMKIHPSKDILFAQPWLNEYGMALELSACAYWVGNYKECQTICHDLLKKDCIPPENREIVQKNLEFANIKLLSNVLSEAERAKP